MKDFILFIKREIGIIKYRFSQERKTLDMFMYRIRNLDQLDETEWAAMKHLAENEKKIYGK